MSICKEPIRKLEIDGKMIEVVMQFNYLGVNFRIVKYLIDWEAEDLIKKVDINRFDGA